MKTDRAILKLQEDVAALKDCLESALTWMAQSANSPFSVTDVQMLLKKMPTPVETKDHKDAAEIRIRSLADGATTEMPRYKCHKEVWALKIQLVTHNSDDSALIVPEESGYEEFHVDADYVRKHKPQVGGYYVVYKDGYKSFSPTKAFEDGYTRVL